MTDLFQEKTLRFRRVIFQVFDAKPITAVYALFFLADVYKSSVPNLEAYLSIE
jgi:hypothetical protein